MNNTNIAQVMNTVADTVKANTDSQPFIIAQALLKVAALPNYNLNSSCTIASPESVSDATDYGVLSQEMMEASGSCGTKSAYFVPTNSGIVKTTDEMGNPNAAQFSVEVGKAYQYIVSKGLIEIV